MNSRDQITESKRWAKFPATVLFLISFYWLLHVIFTRDINQIGNQSETGLGAVGVLFDLVLIPLGSTVVALALLYVQRWSFIPAALLPLYPLLETTIRLVGKIERKFAEYRGQGIENSFGDGIMTALLLIALWVVFGIMLVYIWKSWRIFNAGNEWLNRPARDKSADQAGQASAGACGDDPADTEYDPLFPLIDTEPDSAD